jgi:hypothetical protein
MLSDTMNQTQTLRRRWPMFIAVAFAWLATALFAQAQGTGTIQGRVYNPATKEYVNNAEVRLEGTGQITYSESDGSFRFANVPAGTREMSR